MNAKRKGNRNEYKSIRLLEQAGYSCIRSAASLGVFDIIAVGSEDILMVQVKSNRNAGADEIERMRSFPVPSFCRKLTHIWKDRQPEPIINEIN